MAREVSEHGAIGSNHLALTGGVNSLLAHNALTARSPDQSSTSGARARL